MTIPEKAAAWAEAIAADEAHGYDQSARWGPDYDCSSLVIAAYKQAHGLPALDEAREREILRRGALRVPDGALRGYYLSFLRSLMDLSKEYQRDLAR